LASGRTRPQLSHGTAIPVYGKFNVLASQHDPFTRETPGLSRVGMAAVRRLGRSALMEAKRTWFENDPMSANDPSRT
jgi:hypothetical protein